jgi:hypothetical protein
MMKNDEKMEIKFHSMKILNDILCNFNSIYFNPNSVDFKFDLIQIPLKFNLNSIELNQIQID